MFNKIKFNKDPFDRLFSKKIEIYFQNFLSNSVIVINLERKLIIGLSSFYGSSHFDPINVDFDETKAFCLNSFNKTAFDRNCFLSRNKVSLKVHAGSQLLTRAYVKQHLEIFFGGESKTTFNLTILTFLNDWKSIGESNFLENGVHLHLPLVIFTNGYSRFDSSLILKPLLTLVIDGHSEMVMDYFYWITHLKTTILSHGNVNFTYLSLKKPLEFQSIIGNGILLSYLTMRLFNTLKLHGDGIFALQRIKHKTEEIFELRHHCSVEEYKVIIDSDEMTVKFKGQSFEKNIVDGIQDGSVFVRLRPGVNKIAIETFQDFGQYKDIDVKVMWVNRYL